jgi:hypothetical protein
VAQALPDAAELEVRIEASPETVFAFYLEGWDHFVPRLIEAATGRDPGSDPWSMAPPAGAP